MSTVQSAPARPRPGTAARTPAARRRLWDRATRIAYSACAPQAPYQAAVLRIGLATVVAAFLLREWPHRRVLYGDRSPLSLDMASTLAGEDRAFTVLTWWSGQLWFEAVYALTIAAALAVVVGWRARTMSVLLMLGVLSVENRNPLAGDGGDNLLRIMVVYLVFTRCAEVWSLDARRRARSGGPEGFRDRPGVVLWSAAGLALWWGFGLPATGWALVLWVLWAVHGVWYAVNRWLPRHEVRAVLDGCASMLHNCAMLVIAAQVCLVYSTAGWYKIRGSSWQEGSALYYALHLDYYTPWPGLSEAVTAHALPVLAMCYFTVAVQVAFPFTLLNRRVKNVLLAVMIAEHLGIAVLMGLPFFSLVMVACDAVFLPTAFLVRLETWCTRLTHREGKRPLGAAAPPRPALGPGAGA